MNALCFWGDVHPEQLPEPEVVRQITGRLPIVCNLEAPLTSRQPLGAKRTHLLASPTSVRRLREAGVVAVHVANNHMLDAGEAGVQETLEVLTQSGIETIGLLDSDGKSRLIVLRFADLRIGLLGYGEYCTPPLAALNEAAMLRDLKLARERCDRLIVSLHWGIEYVTIPSPEQQHLARSLVATGAHVVVGHHSHAPSPVEMYRHGCIAYSLGNAALWDSESATFSQSLTGTQLTYEPKLGSIRLDRIQLGGGPGMLTHNHGDCGCGRAQTPLTGWTPYLRTAGPIYLQCQWKSWTHRLKEYGPGQIGPLLRWCLSKRFIQMAWGCILAIPYRSRGRG